MLITIKKNNIIKFILIIFAIIITCVVIKCGYSNIAAYALPFNDKIIIIDAGHGIPDGGATGISGSIEESLNLDVALKLQQLLEQSGAYVLLTRSDNNSVVYDKNKKISEMKTEDLKFRKRMRDDGCDAFISIHMNKFDIEKYKGAQVFYANNEKSKLLGEVIQKSLKEFADNSNNRKAKSSGNDIFILKNSNTAAVLVECGFLSNKQEEILLNTQQYRKKIAYGIYHGIMEYFYMSN